MTYEELRAAIIARMQLFDGIEQSRVDYQNPNGIFAAPNSGVWCRLSIETARPVVSGLCEPSARVPGNIVIQVFEKAKSQAATVNMLKVIDGLVNHFQFWQAGRLMCREAQLVNVRRTDDYCQANIVIYFIAG